MTNAFSKMSDTFSEMNIIYKHGKPDFAFYRGQMIVFSSQRISKDKLGYAAATDDDYTVVVGAPGCFAVIHEDNVYRWIETKRVVGTDKSMLLYLKQQN